ncbi:MAG TPA: hypothetical protein VJT49_09765 [Amycolatopsis sp.]|uniref:hypothetical protein n=1 Tax=Amycolatopsis sp. TaxID=37632 RepID=UPI002B46B8FD|nr:hypothetical protein [Amycolatopsis sp.]HKS45384.1 hypothetical protein [Amycolatopsis sp.]
MKLVRTVGLGIGLLVLLTACEQVGSAADKASVCTEALGLANLNPNVDPEKLVSDAAQKADRLQQLANEVSDQDLKQNLFTLADFYVSMEKRKADELGNTADWIRRNANNIAALRAACL